MDLSALIPTFAFVWIGTLVLAACRSAASARPRRLQALSVASWWISNASWLSIILIAHQAYYRNLFSIPIAILIVILAYAALAGAHWLIESRCIDARDRS